jgi:hypothetical protein
MFDDLIPKAPGMFDDLIPQRRLLTDEEMFGIAAPQRKRLLSDEEMFGVPNAAPGLQKAAIPSIPGGELGKQFGYGLAEGVAGIQGIPGDIDKYASGRAMDSQQARHSRGSSEPCRDAVIPAEHRTGDWRLRKNGRRI